MWGGDKGGGGNVRDHMYNMNTYLQTPQTPFRIYTIPMNDIYLILFTEICELCY